MDCHHTGLRRLLQGGSGECRQGDGVACNVSTCNCALLQHSTRTLAPRLPHSLHDLGAKEGSVLSRSELALDLCEGNPEYSTACVGRIVDLHMYHA